MTVVIDPATTPIPVYTKSGITIVHITAATAPTAIPHVSGHTVAMVARSGGTDNVELPAVAEIGDVVEVYQAVPGMTLDIFPASGDTIRTLTGSVTQAASPGGTIFRKTSATNWSFIAG